MHIWVVILIASRTCHEATSSLAIIPPPNNPSACLMISRLVQTVSARSPSTFAPFLWTIESSTAFLVKNKRKKKIDFSACLFKNVS